MLEFLILNPEATATYVVGALAFFYYKVTKRDQKRDAAKIILQEIRKAERQIELYKTYKSYQFSSRIIAINSWSKNVHHFIPDLTLDEIDEISAVYSTGEYLDSLVRKFSDYQINNGNDYFTKIAQENNFDEAKMAPLITKGLDVVQKCAPTSVQPLLDVVSAQYKPIYHSEICGKLKKISTKKFLFIF